MKLIRFVWQYLPPQRGRYLRAQSLAAIEGLLTALPPLAVGLGLMQLVQGHNEFADIAPWAALCFLSVLLRVAIKGRAWKGGFGAGNHASEVVRNRIVDHMRKVPLGLLGGRWAPARLATLITEDGRWINETSTFYLARFLNGLVASAALLALAAWFEPLAALSALIAIVASIAVMALAKPIITRFIAQRNEMIAEATLRIGEYADGIAVFRSFGGSGDAQRKFRAAVNEMYHKMLSGAPILVPLQQAGAALISFTGPLPLSG